MTRGSAAVATHTYRWRESISHFHIAVRRFTWIIDRGDPYKMWLVAVHHNRRLPTNLEGLLDLLVHGTWGPTDPGVHARLQCHTITTA